MKKSVSILFLLGLWVFFPLIAQAAPTFNLACDDSALQETDLVTCTLTAYDVAASEALTTYKTTIKLEDMTLTKVVLGEGWSGTTTGGNINVSHEGATGTFVVFSFEAKLNEDAVECGVIVLSDTTYNANKADDKEKVIEVPEDPKNPTPPPVTENPDTDSDMTVFIMMLGGILVAGSAVMIATKYKKVHKIQTL